MDPVSRIASKHLHAIGNLLFYNGFWMPRVPDEQVLSAAIDVMVRHGYGGATTKKIAEAAGINEVTLFRRFGSKANLLRTAMLAEVEGFGGPEGIHYSGDVASDLVHVVRAYGALLERRGRLVPLLLAELPRHEELADVVAIPQRLMGSIAELVARYQGEGVLVEEPPLRAVASLLAPLLMPAILGSHAPPGAHTELDPELHVARFLDGHRLSSGSG